MPANKQQMGFNSGFKGLIKNLSPIDLEIGMDSNVRCMRNLDKNI